MALLSIIAAQKGDDFVSDKYAVDMKNIVKKFSGVTVLDEVNLQVKQGEIHALIGENGAGKSTLMNILSGGFSHHAYEGEVYIEGRKTKMNTPKDANGEGIVMVHQELALIPELTVAENMFLGNLPIKNSGIDWKKVYTESENILKKLALEINVRTKVKYLSIGQQQLVEIAKAIMLGGRIMILDEPTAPLTGREIEVLFNILRELKNRGITIIYISHRLEEIFELTDRITVMRDGKKIVTVSTDQITQEKLVSYMIGRDMQDYYPDTETVAGNTILEIQNYYVEHPVYQGKNIVDNVNMQFKKGEIVGISGLLGAGRTELMSSVAGVYRKKGHGIVKLDGKVIEFKNARRAIQNGIGYVTEDRKGNGLIVSKSIIFNTTLASLDKIKKHRCLNQKVEAGFVKELADKLGIKTTDIRNKVSSLSGGNQQKVVLAKWILTTPKILILDEPTRGVDVGAKYEIYSIMKELAKEGVSIIMISSDLPEIIGMSDRVYIMHEGRVTGQLLKQELSEEKIMKYATGTVAQ
ncbi:sugar ABC transporter ATP-binding protein [Anaerobium acetethylicum]|uniref:D-xylose transport system ATP-binding protein n=1 Tax=Anaerobium acetethylicum TaxID=1619234 RepID=A0A1D3TXA2_9FIRM|nr:sugar ABC transporter ATP-binding protein [Anaerobium acetethylicum]SCP98951.1 D-xylose transport system ATP-binding protein [Anaerobium acetethylicum]